MPPPAPLQPLPVIATPFTHAMVDGVGPLPETGRGSEYLLTVLDMVRAYRVRFPTEWDVAMPFLMFATRDSVCESTGVTPFRLGCGHGVRGPLQMLKERVTRPPVWHEPLEYVARFTDWLQAACETACERLAGAEGRMKAQYDGRAVPRRFNPGDQALVILPGGGDGLGVRFEGPCDVVRASGLCGYVIATPGRGVRTRLCHVNLLKGCEGSGAAPLVSFAEGLRKRQERRDRRVAAECGVPSRGEKLESERERCAAIELGHADRAEALELRISEQAEEIRTLVASRDTLAEELKQLREETERNQRDIRRELECAGLHHLQELEERLKRLHPAQIETLAEENREALEETKLLHEEVKQQARDAEVERADRIRKLREDLDWQTEAQRREREEQLGSFQEQEQHLRIVISDLQARNELYSKRLEQEERVTRSGLGTEEAFKAVALPDARADVPAADLDPAPLLRRKESPGGDPSRCCRPSRLRRLAGKAQRKAPENVARCTDHLRVAGKGARERLAKTLGHMKIKHDKRTLRLGGGGKLGTHFGGPHIVVRVSELHHSDPGGPVLALRIGGGGKLGTRFGGPHTVACVSDPHNHLDGVNNVVVGALSGGPG